MWTWVLGYFAVGLVYALIGLLIDSEWGDKRIPLRILLLATGLSVVIWPFELLVQVRYHLSKEYAEKVEARMESHLNRWSHQSPQTKDDPQ